MKCFIHMLLLLTFGTQIFANPPGTFLKTADGIIVYPAQKFPGNASVVRLQVINNNIIRVTAS